MVTRQITKQYFNKGLIMTSEDEEIYNNSKICWICKQEWNTDKVSDHFHVTGRFRGAALNKFYPKGIDKFMSIIVNRHIIFIDSPQFYNGSHDTLASNLNS